MICPQCRKTYRNKGVIAIRGERRERCCSYQCAHERIEADTCPELPALDWAVVMANVAKIYEGAQ